MKFSFGRIETPEVLTNFSQCSHRRSRWNLVGSFCRIETPEVLTNFSQCSPRGSKWNSMPFGAPADRIGRWTSGNWKQWQHTFRLGPSIHQVGSPNRWISDEMAAYVVAEILNPPSWMPKSLKISLGRSLGESRGGFWGGLGRSWEASGRSWASSGGVLGGVWVVLGRFWGGLGRFLGWSWGHVGPKTRLRAENRCESKFLTPPGPPKWSTKSLRNYCFCNPKNYKFRMWFYDCFLLDFFYWF